MPKQSAGGCTGTVEEDDSSHNEVQSAGPETLVIESAILDHTAAVKAHRAAQRILGFALVQADGHTAAQLGALQPIKREQIGRNAICAAGFSAELL